MKRGLVVLDPAEISGREWQQRLAILQRAMAASGIDTALIYGDVSRADDIAYLTNLCVYWNEGILAVPAHGDPVFLTKLSPRVHPWMRQVSTVTDLRSGQSLGKLAADLLGPGNGRTAGIVDADLWPAVLSEEISAGLPGWEVRKLGGLVREQRLTPSPAELVLLRRGAGILAAAAGKAAGEQADANARIAIIERELRGAGFLDVVARAADAPDGILTLRVSGQFRTGWLHASRLAGDGNGTSWPDAMRQAIGRAVPAASAGACGARLSEAARPALSALPPGTAVDVRWVHEADMATSGEYQPYSPDLPMAEGSVVVIGIEARFPDGGDAAVAETVLIGTGGAECLTDPVLTGMGTAAPGGRAGS
jgi:Xaa-Pro aminopeptidase